MAKVALMKVNPYLVLSIALVATFLTAGIAGAGTLVESPHPYPNNYQNTWVISQPGANQMRLHFTKMEIGYGDTLQLLDANNNVLMTYSGRSSLLSEGPTLKEDYWSEWYALDTIKLKLITNNEGNYYGFRVDQVDKRVTEQPPSQNLYESWHDYANNYQNTWVISQPGANQMRLHFTKMEIGYGDTLQLLDANNNVLMTYSGRSSLLSEGPTLKEDYWSEWYALDTIKLKLITNNEGNYYGFRVDQVDKRVTEQPPSQNLYESWHDYANNYQNTWVISQPGANQMRLHFTKMEIGYGDTLQLLDANNNVLMTYSGRSSLLSEGPTLKEDYWSEWYALDTIKLKLITNNEGNYYGFRVDQVDKRVTEQPPSQNLYESWHDYANNYQNTWVISQPGANQMRLHFTKMEIGYGDTLQLLDANNNVLMTYSGRSSLLSEGPTLKEDYWSEWYALDTIKLKLITNNEGNYYGFRVDQVDKRVTEQPPSQNLYESWHDYANNYQNTWVISQPGANQMRLHFTKMEIGYGDTLQLLDANNNVLMTYSGRSSLLSEGPTLKEDYWSEWYALDTIKLKLITNNEGNYYGFRVDQVDKRVTEQPPSQNLYESWHDYANNYQNTWVISQPGANQMRLHFTKMEIGYGDTLQLLDANNNVLMTYSGRSSLLSEGPTLKEDYWSEWYALDTIKLKLITNNEGNYYGFRVDQVDPPITIPLGIVTNLHNTTYNQDSITWAWTDPTDADFDHVMVYLNGAFQSNVTKGTQVYSATGLSPSTVYTIGTRTVGTTGLVNSTWINQTASTAPETITPVPPESISNLHNTTYNQNSITWAWTDPSSSDFDHVMVYLNGAFQSNVTKGTQVYSATGLSPSTAYTIGTRTVGTTGIVNSTWVNQTASTAPETITPVPPASISNLHNTTYNQNSITWAWTDPSSSDFDHVMVYLNGAFQSNMTKGTQVFSATGLSPSTAYTIGTRTVGTTGIVNSTWVNKTASTAPDTDPGILPPAAQFSSNTTSGTAPLTVQFNDSSSGTVTSYAWDFGDGASSTKKNPVHTYTNSGMYNVSLTVTNAAGEDTIIKNDFIQVNPLVGGDTGYYLIHCNVDGAGVYFDKDYKGVITDGTLLVKIYLTATPYHRYSVSKAGYVTVNEALPVYPAKDQTKDIFVTLVKDTDDSWTRPPYPEVTRIQPGYPDTNWTRPPYPEVTRIQPAYPDTNWTRPPYPEVTRIQPGYPDTNWTRPPYPEVTRIQPGYPDTNWTRPPYPEVTRIQPGYPDINWTRLTYPDWLWSRLSIKNFLKNIF